MFENLENNKITYDEINEIINTNDPIKINELTNKARKIQSKHPNIYLETDIFYPNIYSVTNDCPTCGFQTPESKREYNPLYIKEVIGYKLHNIKDYNITGINCYSRCKYKIHELKILLDTIKKFDIDVNVKLDNLDDYFEIKDYNIHSLIIDYKNTTFLPSNRNVDKEFDKTWDKLLKIFKDNPQIKLTYEFMINYSETVDDLIKSFTHMQHIEPENLQVIGYDPFFDSPGEYNPQYTQEYLTKILAILRILYPKTNIKLQYATNKNNNLNMDTQIAINTITGVYTNKTSHLYNVDEVTKHTKYLL